MRTLHFGQQCPQCLQPLKYEGMAAHLRSSRHRIQRRTRLRRLLADPNISMAEIGRRFGISRERVRQLVGTVPLGGWGHIGQVHARERRRQKAEAVLGDHSLVQYLNHDLGYAVEPVMGATRERTSKRQLFINGRHCIVRGACRITSDDSTLGEGYVVIAPFKKDYVAHRGVEFVLYRLPEDSPVKGWLVVPADAEPAYQRRVKLTEPHKGYPRQQVTPWRQWVNAWDQL